MNTLQFIDSMTNRLAWPLSAIILGLIFRRSLTQLLGRVRRLKWKEGEAELAELAAATDDVELAVQEAAAPLPEDEEEREAAQRSRIERLMSDAASLGFHLAQRRPYGPAPQFRINWDGDHPVLAIELKPYDTASPKEWPDPWELVAADDLGKALRLNLPYRRDRNP
ncbi:hypothetical protein GCM10029978_117380 [Actinoallomurus acanthiterrae]